jgi:hypothetical protein
LAAPAFHRALLQQVPCLDLMLAKPLVQDALLGKGIRLHLPILQAAVQACGSRLVPLLQVLVEVAVLQAGTPMFVHGAVNTMMRLVCGCSAPSGSLDQAVGSSSSSSSSSSSRAQGAGQQLHPVQAAGLLAPVLHLLSAAVLHVLGTPVEGAVSPEDELSSEDQADLECQFGALVVAVVLPGAAVRLLLAGSQEGLTADAQDTRCTAQQVAGSVGLTTCMSCCPAALS